MYAWPAMVGNGDQYLDETIDRDGSDKESKEKAGTVFYVMPLSHKFIYIHWARLNTAHAYL